MKIVSKKFLLKYGKNNQYSSIFIAKIYKGLNTFEKIIKNNEKKLVVLSILLMRG